MAKCRSSGGRKGNTIVERPVFFLLLLLLLLLLDVVGRSAANPGPSC
jgi:hypothetical protein